MHTLTKKKENKQGNLDNLWKEKKQKKKLWDGVLGWGTITTTGVQKECLNNRGEKQQKEEKRQIKPGGVRSNGRESGELDCEKG